MKTIAVALGTVCLATGALIAADEGAFRPVLSNHPDLIRPDHQCPVSFSREPLRYYTGQVIQEGHRLILDADAYPRAAGRLVRKPTLQRSDRGWTISFALDQPDDIELRIVAADGAVIRRLGCGVLGPNSPEPFRKDSLQQEVFWDGRDTEGRPAPADCRAELRVGLTPKFERFIGYDPASVIPQLIAFEVDAQGRLYVATSAENRSDPTLVRFDRDGRYLDMVYPPGPPQLKGRKIEDVYRCGEYLDGREMPTRARSWSQYIYQWPAGAMLPFRMDSRDHGYVAEILTGWGSADVAMTTPYRVFPTGDGNGFWFLQNITLLQSSAAFALDGNGGAYLAARTFELSKGGSAFDGNGIGRIRKINLATGQPDATFSWNGEVELSEPSAFLGTPFPQPSKDPKTGKVTPPKMPSPPTAKDPDADSPHHFVDIKDLAVDARGRLLVVDSRPRRIKVYEPNGHFAGILDHVTVAGTERPFSDIRALRAVNDELYLLASFEDGPMSLIKCRGDILSPSLVWQQTVDKAAQYLAVDAGSLPVKKGTGPICRNGPEGAAHKLDLSPFSRIVWCGNGNGPGTFSRAVDEGSGCGSLQHFGGTQAHCFSFPCSIAADGDGHLFAYDLVRKKIIRTDDQGSQWHEVDAPFSLVTLYVDRVNKRLLATAPGKLACYDLDLTPIQDQKAEDRKHPKLVRLPPRVAGPWSTRSGGIFGGVDREGNLYVSDGLSEKEAKGRELKGQIRRFGPDGSLLDETLVQLTFPSGGLAVDSRGGIYALDLAYAQRWEHVAHNLPCGLGRDGVGPARLMFRRGDRPVWQQSDLCYLVKFGPAGGVRNTESELWSHRGFSPHSAGGCQCDWPRGVLAIDAADRIFGADAIHHHVKVLDVAGNLITRLGWWGNAQTVPADGDARNFGLWNIYSLTAAGDSLYVSDKDLRRIAKFRMDYRDVQTATVQ